MIKRVKYINRLSLKTKMPFGKLARLTYEKVLFRRGNQEPDENLQEIAAAITTTPAVKYSE